MRRDASIQGRLMAFEGLSEKLQGAFKDLRGQGVVSEKDFEDAMRVVKMALLEADVNFKVVKDFVATIKEKALESYEERLGLIASYKTNQELAAKAFSIIDSAEITETYADKLKTIIGKIAE